MHLQRGMLSWQGGGHRRRFVRRKEPLKTWDPRHIFFAARLLASERLETRSAAFVAARSEPLKQATISLRPGPYSARGGRWRETFEFHWVEESNDSRAVSGGGKRNGWPAERMARGSRGTWLGAIYDAFYRYLRLPFSAILFPPAFACTRTPSIPPPIGYRSPPMTPNGASALALVQPSPLRVMYVHTYFYVHHVCDECSCVETSNGGNANGYPFAYAHRKRGVSHFPLILFAAV